MTQWHLRARGGAAGAKGWQRELVLRAAGKHCWPELLGRRGGEIPCAGEIRKAIWENAGLRRVLEWRVGRRGRHSWGGDAVPQNVTVLRVLKEAAALKRGQ